MTWQGIHGHDEVIGRFREAVGRGRLASSFLFVGPPGVGKHTTAVALAQALLCTTHPESELAACGRCEACEQVAARSHPDLVLVSKPEDKSFLPLELLIGDKEHRMREGLCHDIGLKPFAGGRKIAVIDDADFLNAEGANCLLKTLEEPPPRSVMILVGTSPAKQLPTIRSRCQIVRFQPLPDEVVAELLLSQGHVSDPREAQRLARFAQGSLRQAIEWLDPALWEFRDDFLRQLAQPVLESVRLARSVGAFIDEAGREAPKRRRRFHQVVAVAVDFYRRVMVASVGRADEGDDKLAESVRRAQAGWATHAEAPAACLQRCLAAAGQIDRNANQATLIECWLDDLATAMAER
ncbi:MAG: DNA polymerase III subunit [Pirellulales bacterium]|nr:DNA polymerase III subunit [Pirellulales bacterium]